MKSGESLFCLLFVLFITCTVSETYDTSNIAIIEVPSSKLKDSDQKTHCELENHGAGDVTGTQGTDQLTEMQRGGELSETSGSQRRPPSIFKPSPEILRENMFVINNPVVPERSLELVSNEEIYINNLEYLQLNNDVKSPNLQSPYPGMPFTLIQLLRPPITPSPEYAVDIANNPNTHLENSLVLKKQPSRRHMSDRDLLEQLEHDAIMLNILPTMEAPFFRDAYPAHQELQMPSMPRYDTVAYFPEAYDVPITILLTCSPKITQGYQENLQVPLPYYNSRETFRQDPTQLDGYKK